MNKEISEIDIKTYDADGFISKSYVAHEQTKIMDCERAITRIVLEIEELTIIMAEVGSGTPAGHEQYEKIKLAARQLAAEYVTKALRSASLRDALKRGPLRGSA